MLEKEPHRVEIWVIQKEWHYGHSSRCSEDRPVEHEVQVLEQRVEPVRLIVEGYQALNHRELHKEGAGYADQGGAESDRDFLECGDKQVFRLALTVATCCSWVILIVDVLVILLLFQILQGLILVGEV